MTPDPPHVVRRSSWRDEHLECICGFANARGGVLEIGKDDNGEIVGIRNVLSLLEHIPKKARALLGIVVKVNLRSESDLEYIEVAVEPHPIPISHRGRFHYRNGSTKPAELPADWSVSTTGEMPSDPHNPRVAHAFFRAGLIEAWGRGIHQIRERCAEAGNPTPLWGREPGGVLRLRFPFSEAYLAADSAV